MNYSAKNKKTQLNFTPAFEKAVLVKIDEIIVEEKFQIRQGGISEKTLKKYKYFYCRTRKDGKRQLPPILVVRINGRLYLVAGFHRYEAAKQAGLTEIEVEICEDCDEKAALWIIIGEISLKVGLVRRNDKNVRSIK